MDIFGLIPSFGNLAFTILAFVAALSIIVFVHEYGHYIVGRWSGIHAEVFSIGFGPVLFARTDRRGTRWQVAALPLGGYVRFKGDGDASGVTQDEGFLEHIAHVEREKELRRTMHGAPLWARAATVAAGPVFNFILSLLVFAAVFFTRGENIEPPTVGALKPMPAAENGLRPGDAILAVEGIETPDYAAFLAALDRIDPAPTIDYTVRRDGEETVTAAPWPLPVIITGLTPGSAATEAGLQVGDVITAIDGTPITAFSELQTIVRGSDGRQMTLDVWREGRTFQVTLAPKRMDLPVPSGGFETRWLIGLSGGMAFDPATAPIGPFDALGQGVEQVWFLIDASLSGLWHIVTGAISACNIQGPLGIAEASGDMASQGLGSFIWFVAVLSTAVGLLNLFPIPVLDGGHLVFHAYEAVFRRPPSDFALKGMMAVGLTLILALMAFALINDVRCP